MILINIGVRQKPKFLKISVGFVKFVNWYQSSKNPKWQDTQKSEKSRIAKITGLVMLSVSSVKRLFPVILKLALVVLIETLLYSIFICMSIVY